MESLKGKVVLITGSSMGIGRETAFSFAKEGAKVIITYYRDEEQAAAAAKKCEGLGSADASALRLDVTDLDSIRDVLKHVSRKFGKIDFLVNNAGLITWKHLKEQFYEEVSSQIDVNLTGLIKMTKETLPMVTKAVINISSGSGKRGYENLSVYCATKFGVRGFTKALACETEIKVLSVNPPLTKTRMSNFKGISPVKVAKVICNTAKSIGSIPTGSDIDVPKE